MKNVKFAVLGLVLAAGCGERDATLFTCEGVSYTERMHASDVAYRTSLLRDTIAIQGIRGKELDEIEKNVIEKIPDNILQDFVAYYPLVGALSSGKLEVDPQAEKKVKEMFLRSMSRYGKTWEELEKAFEDRGQLEPFKRSVNLVIARESLKAKAIRTAKPVDEANVKRISGNRTLYNQKAAEMNAALKARAAEIAAQMTAKSDFKDFLTEIEKKNEHIIVEDIADLAEGDLLDEDKYAFKEIRATADGACTKVLEMLDGYVVYHKLGIAENVEFNPDDPSFKLQSLTFHQLDSYEKFTEDDIREALIQSNREKAIKAAILQVVTNMPIVVSRPESEMGRKIEKISTVFLKEMKDAEGEKK